MMPVGRWTRRWPGEENFSLKSAQPLNDFAPLICRVVRAVRVRGRWAWIPGGGLRFAPVFTPNLQYVLNMHGWNGPKMM